MKQSKFQLTVIATAMLMACQFSNRVNAQGASFVDHGFIPITNIQAGKNAEAENQCTLIHNGELFIATNKGIWKNNLTTKVWTSAGLSDKKITCLYKHPTLNKLFAGALIGPLGGGNTVPLYVSTDDGATWNPVTSPVMDNYYSILMRPNNPNHLYASIEGFNFAVSIDAGNSWVFYNNGSGGAIGFTVCMAFVNSDPNHLYIGSENPLDDAWLGRYTINATNPTHLDSLTYIVRSPFYDGPWGNRRPNRLNTYPYTGNFIYVGHEGAYSKVNPSGIDSTTFIYKSMDEAHKPYTYMYGHWVDPNNTQHHVFGGAGNGGNLNNLQLYETFDEGNTFYKYTNTFGISSPNVIDIADIGGGKIAISITDEDNNKVKLVVMQPTLTSTNDINILSKLQVYPNPTTDIVFISCESLFKNIKATIYDMNGCEILSKSLLNNRAEIGIKHLPSGIYLIEINADEHYITKKIIKN